MDDKQSSESKRRQKAERNRANYLKSVKQREHILLRLAPGDLAIFDSARKATGLSRSAFASAYLTPLMAAMAKNPELLGPNRDGEHVGSAAMFADALLATGSGAPTADAEVSSNVANEFDALFRSSAT